MRLIDPRWCRFIGHTWGQWEKARSKRTFVDSQTVAFVTVQYRTCRRCRFARLEELVT